MSHNKKKLRLYHLLITGMCLPAIAWAETDTQKLERLERELAQLREVLQLQQQKLEQQARSIGAQDAMIQQQSALLTSQQGDLQHIRARLLPAPELRELRAAGTATPAAPRGAPARIQVSQSESPTPDKPVGQAPPKKKEEPRPEVQSIANIGGVLTPKGTWVLEPALQFSNSQVNRLSFLGVEILETFLIGIIEAEDADRNLVSPSVTLRYGLTPRLEIEGKLPYIWREDTLKATIPSVSGSPQVTRDLQGSDIGDAELALHYQLNAGNDGWPIFIGNLRYKSTTGVGPYEVTRNSSGVQTELPTGSGFHGIEPSVTALYQSDPAVFYANLAYLFNLSDDVNKTFVIEGSDDQTVGEVDPGDVVRISFGMAYSINSKSSFSLGYKHDFIQETDTMINGVKLSNSSLDVGAMLLGFSHRISPHLSANLNLELGVTADAPDVGVTLRFPYTF